MSTRTMHFACLVVALSVFFMGFCGSSAFATIKGCDVKDMQALAPTFPWPLTIATVTDVAASGSTPEYCDVVGYVATNGEGAGVGSAGLEVGFPASWNGKYLFFGNGGLGSGLYLATAGVEGLQKGYAVAMTDMGHTPVPAGNSFYGNWALLSPVFPTRRPSSTFTIAPPTRRHSSVNNSSKRTFRNIIEARAGSPVPTTRGAPQAGGRAWWKHNVTLTISTDS